MATIYSEGDNIRRYAAALSVLMLMLAVKTCCVSRAAKADGNTLPFRYLGIKLWPDDCTRARSKKTYYNPLLAAKV